MPTLILLGLGGFLAQLINSSLGMGYGVTSTTFLLLLGTSPALASATVNVSQVGSQLVSGIAHWRLGNVDWRVAWHIAVPGAVGAFFGAAFLTWLSTEVARPMMAVILLTLGLYVLVRFTVWGTPRGKLGKPLRVAFLAPLGLVGGFFNSTGGGGWGPIGTSALLASGRIEPRKVIGSISAAEFVVVVAGSAGFALGLGLSGLNYQWVGVMLAGGLLAAAPAAWLARHVPPRMLGSMVGGLIVVVNIRNLLHAGAETLPVPAQLTIFGAALLAWAGAITWSIRAHLAARARERVVQLAGAPAADAAGPAAPVAAAE